MNPAGPPVSAAGVTSGAPNGGASGARREGL